MNIQAMAVVLSVAAFFVAFVSGCCNPFFEDKRLLRWTLILFGISVVSAMVAAGLQR